MGRRAPHAASVLGEEFDYARAGAASGADHSVAFLGDRLFVIADRDAGRRVYEHDAGGWRLHAKAGGWVHELVGGCRLNAWSAAGNEAKAGHLTSYDGQRWTSPSLAGAPTSRTVLRADGRYAFRARRTYPGMSVCEVGDLTTGRVVGRWRAPVVGTGTWDGDRLWLQYESWPRQRLVAWSVDARTVVTDLPLPPGRLSSLSLSDDTAAAIWTDPTTPAAAVLCDRVELLPEVLAARPRHAAAGGSHALHKSAARELAGVPVVLSTPVDKVIGRIIMVHGGPHSSVWPEFSPLTAWLCRLGWEVVSPNVRSSSLGSRYTPGTCRLGIDDAEDLVRLGSRLTDGKPLVLAGWSYGGYLAGRAIGLGLRCQGLVSLCGFLRPGALRRSRHPAIAAFRTAYDLPEPDVDALARVPLLVIHGVDDDRIPIDEMSAYAASHPMSQLVTLTHEGHGITTDPAAATGYAALADWLAKLPVAAA